MIEFLRDLAIFGCGALGAIVWAWLTRRSLRRAGISEQSPACPKCSYLVRGWTTPVCPECGTDVGVTGVRIGRSAPIALAATLVVGCIFTSVGWGLETGSEYVLSRTMDYHETTCKFGDRQQAVADIRSFVEEWDHLPLAAASNIRVILLAEEVDVAVKLEEGDVTPAHLLAAVKPFRTLIHEDYAVARFDEMCDALEAMSGRVRDGKLLGEVLAKGAAFVERSSLRESKTPHRRAEAVSWLIAGVLSIGLLYVAIRAIRRIKPSIRPPSAEEWQSLTSSRSPPAEPGATGA